MAINLTKGQRIDLKKSGGAALTDFCVGVNWGGIESRGFMGLTKKVEKVDLDLSAALLDSQGALCDHIYSPLYKPELLNQFGLPPGKLSAANNALNHTGDDQAGDSGRR
jgi:tellurium resistance protein TerZ